MASFFQKLEEFSYRVPMGVIGTSLKTQPRPIGSEFSCVKPLLPITRQFFSIFFSKCIVVWISLDTRTSPCNANACSFAVHGWVFVYSLACHAKNRCRPYSGKFYLRLNQCHSYLGMFHFIFCFRRLDRCRSNLGMFHFIICLLSTTGI